MGSHWFGPTATCHPGAFQGFQRHLRAEGAHHQPVLPAPEPSKPGQVAKQRPLKDPCRGNPPLLFLPPPNFQQTDWMHFLWIPRVASPVDLPFPILVWYPVAILLGGCTTNASKPLPRKLSRLELWGMGPSVSPMFRPNLCIGDICPKKPRAGAKSREQTLDGVVASFRGNQYLWGIKPQNIKTKIAQST